MHLASCSPARAASPEFLLSSAMNQFNTLRDELHERVFELVPYEHRYTADVGRRSRNLYPSKKTTSVSIVQPVARLQIRMDERDDGLERKVSCVLPLV